MFELYGGPEPGPAPLAPRFTAPDRPVEDRFGDLEEPLELGSPAGEDVARAQVGVQIEPLDLVADERHELLGPRLEDVGEHRSGAQLRRAPSHHRDLDHLVIGPGAGLAVLAAYSAATFLAGTSTFLIRDS